MKDSPHAGGRARPWGALVALLALFVAGSCSAHASTPSRTATADQRLDAALHDLVAGPGGPPGAIVVLGRGGHTRVDAAGVAAVGSSDAPRLNDHMRLASVSKALGGAAALALVAQGKLTLNDTIGQLLTALPSTWAPVTLAELLNHTSGLPDYTASKGFAEGLTSAPLQAPSPGELLGYVEDEPLRFTPGSRFAYSNSDNIVIALMLQAVTGLPYSTVLEREVFSPLGLSQTSLPSTATLREPFMHGYSIGSSGKPEDVSEFAPGWAWASGGVVSTPANLSRFISAYVRGATTNSATHTRQFQFIKNASSDPPGPGANSAGLAIFRYQTSCGTVYGHTGNLPGYTQFAAASANGSRSVTVSVNAQISPLSDPQQFRELRHVYDLAVCAALTG